MPLVWKMLDAGVSIKRIARDLNVHRNTIHRHLQKRKAPTGDTEGAANHPEGGPTITEDGPTNPEDGPTNPEDGTKVNGPSVPLDSQA